MDIFWSTLNQLGFLFSLILVGFLLVKCKVLTGNAANILAKIENVILIPAMVLGAFIKNFTLEGLKTSWQPLLLCAVVLLLTIPLAFLFAHFLEKDVYHKRISTFVLIFSNYGFMGNTIMLAIFPDYFYEYIIFTLPLHVLTYMWGAPALLIADATGEKRPLSAKIKAFFNPMIVAVLIGMIVGITGLGKILPKWVNLTIDSSTDCMAPVGMILTGITVSDIKFKEMLKNWRIYVVSLLRLVVIPLLFIGLFKLNEILGWIPLGKSLVACTVCMLSMPLGLNAVIIPRAYDKNTDAAAGMVILSHVLSIVTIPLVFMLL
ncbi:MAG: AEC family transporter [Clostridia bacterium]|nr:AEC family transporter [Clostridia bacterium]